MTTRPLNFALTGAAGYIAPRHMQAIKDTGHRLVAALDPHDAAGIMDRYFFDAAFFTEFERFDRHLEKLRRQNPTDKVDFVSICVPNYLHDAHIRFALRLGANAICEKPLVLNPWNCDALQELEAEQNGRVFTVLQLRVHPAVVALREKLLADQSGRRRQVELTYITSRGQWYLHSWKGDIMRSGGLATNIGIHFFDLLLWLFGGVSRNEVHLAEPRRTAGFLELERADIRWFLSIDRHDLPEAAQQKQQNTYRSITLDGEELEFSGGFENLHTRVYEGIIAGQGFGVAEARPSIQLAHDIRNASVVKPSGKTHALVKG